MLKLVGIVKYLVKVLNLLINKMNYATGCAFNLDEMLINLDKSKLKMTCDLCERINGNKHKDILIKQICLEGTKLVLDDIIDNNVTFELPTGSARKTQIRMERFTGDDFAKARRNGKFTEVDFLTSNFSGYQLMLEMFYKDGSPRRKKSIYVDSTRKQRIIDHTNNGKQYY